MTEPTPWTLPGTPPAASPGSPAPTALPSAQPPGTHPVAAYPAAAYPAGHPPGAYPPGGYPPGGYRPAPSAPAKPSKALSVTAFVIGLLGCIPLASVVAVVVGIVALVKERAGRAFAIAGIVLGLLWTAAFVVAFVADVPTRIAHATTEAFDGMVFYDGSDFDSRLTAELSVGDCLDDPMVSDIVDADRAISVTDCATPHDLEVYATFELDEYTTAEEMLWTTEETCLDSFTDFVGKGYYRSELAVYTYFPSQDSWDDGIRTVTCTVGDWEQVTGTLRGANR